MKFKKLYTLILSALIFVSVAFAGQTNLIIVHPGVFSLESFQYLIDEKVIDIPDLHIIALFYDKVEYNLPRIEKYINEREDDLVEMRVLSGHLNPDNLFQKNDLSDDFAALVQETDGVLFLGGDDIPPAIYGEEINLLTSIGTPNRHYFELSFYFHMLGGFQDENFEPLLLQKPDYVVNGFCLGMQTLNVATGGTMIQDIPTEVYNCSTAEMMLKLDPNQQHKNYFQYYGIYDGIAWGNFHQVKFVKDQMFVKKLKQKKNFAPYVLSIHHQAVEKIGKNLEITATSMDGKIVEGLAHTQFTNVFAVQFHPEKSRLYGEGDQVYKHSPEDTDISFNEKLRQTGSYEFHRAYWNYFNSLFAK